MQTTQCASDKYLVILYKSMQLKYMTLHPKTNRVFAVQLFSWNRNNKLLQVQWEILFEDVERMYKILQNAMARPLETWGGSIATRCLPTATKLLKRRSSRRGGSVKEQKKKKTKKRKRLQPAIKTSRETAAQPRVSSWEIHNWVEFTKAIFRW